MTNAQKFEAGIPVNLTEEDWSEWFNLREQKEQMQFAHFMINHRDQARQAITNVNGVNVINPSLYKLYEQSKH